MGNRKACLIIFFVGLIFAAATAFGQPAVYVYTGKVNVAFGWDHTKDENFDHYELELRRLGASDVVIETFTYGTSNPSISVLRPRAGTYEGRVRTVNKYSDGSYQQSDWCSSLNPACAMRKDGSQGDWKVRWKISAPIILGPITDE